jgi:hypothetical protein
MAETISSRFLKAFDVNNERHVTWLAKMMSMASGIDKGTDFVKLVNENPMGVLLSQQDALDWPHIHFVLGMAYAKAVLTDKAFIPSRKVD